MLQRKAYSLPHSNHSLTHIVFQAKRANSLAVPATDMTSLTCLDSTGSEASA